MNLLNTINEERNFNEGFELFKQKGKYKVYLPTANNVDTLIKFATVFTNATKEQVENEDGEIEEVIKDDEANKELIELITNLNYDNYMKAPKLKLTDAILSNYISEAMLEIMEYIMSNGELSIKLEEMGMSNSGKEQETPNEIQEEDKEIEDNDVEENMSNAEEIARLKAMILELENKQK